MTTRRTILLAAMLLFVLAFTTGAEARTAALEAAPYVKIDNPEPLPYDGPQWLIALMPRSMTPIANLFSDPVDDPGKPVSDWAEKSAMRTLVPQD